MRKQEITPELIRTATLHLAGFPAGSEGTAAMKDIDRRAKALLEEALDMGFVYVPIERIPRLRDLMPKCASQLPRALFLGGRGSAEDLIANLSTRTLAVVGTRNITHYGRDIVRRFMAMVTDTALVTDFSLGTGFEAMKGALQRGLPVVACPGTGPGDCYPYSMRDLLAKILDTPGCAVVTPFFPHSEPTPYNFLYRNRVVAALADKVLVPETKLKGGAMVTARLASSFGKEVAAVPGRIDDIYSHGCNQLIAEGTATMWLPWKAETYSNE